MFKVTNKKHMLKIASIGLVSLGLLSACQHRTKEDHYASLGIPASNEKYPKNVAVVQDPKPQTAQEIASTNQVKKSFGEKGTAATYKESSVGNLTASGEPYDDMAMTAGHSSLPFSSFVKVKNLVNGKETIVRINDRNQSKRNVIQLSYAAAYKLGIHSGGKAPVEITRFDPNADEQTAQMDVEDNTLASNQDILIRPVNSNESEFNARPSLTPHEIPSTVSEFDTQPNITPQRTSEVSNFNTSTPQARTVEDDSVVSKITDDYSIYLQVGSFRQKENAERLIKQAGTLAKDTNTNVQIYEVQVKDKPMYKVRFGPVDNMKDARELENKLSAENMNSLTVFN